VDPRHDPRRIREARQAVRDAREEIRAAAGRQRNGSILALVEGFLCASVLAGVSDADLPLLGLIKDYLIKGLQVSRNLREFIDVLLDGGSVQEGEEREIILDMLKGAVGLLSGARKESVYGLLRMREKFLCLRGEEWDRVIILLDEALGRGVFAFRC
jgi:hypothetical protein